MVSGPTSVPSSTNPTRSIPSQRGQPVFLKILDAPGTIEMPVETDIIGAAHTTYDAKIQKGMNITKLYRIENEL